MVGRCDYCKETRRIDSKARLCAGCLWNFQELLQGHFEESQLDARLYLAAAAAREGRPVNVTDVAIAAEIGRIEIATELRKQKRETLSGSATTRRPRRRSRPRR